jgi:hypothetical protein
MKRLGIIMVLLAMSLLAGAGIAWYQVTQLPSWYRPTAPTLASPAHHSQVNQKLQALYGPNATVSLTSQEVNDVVTATLVQVGQDARVPNAIKGVHTELKDGQLKAEAVVDLAQLQEGKFAQAEQAVLSKVLAKLPGLRDREVYIGLETSPQVVNGQVKLDRATRVKVGNVSLSLEDVAQQLGVSPAELEQGLNKALPLALSGLPVQDLTVQAGNLVLKSGQQ